MRLRSRGPARAKPKRKNWSGAVISVKRANNSSLKMSLKMSLFARQEITISRVPRSRQIM
jgi:hypothetical protein